MLSAFNRDQPRGLAARVALLHENGGGRGGGLAEGDEPGVRRQRPEPSRRSLNRDGMRRTSGVGQVRGRAG